VIASSLAVLIASCVGPSKYQVTGSTRAPDADGRISVEKVEGGNSMVTLTVDHLAPPQRMVNAATTYVVWFQRPGQAPVIVGQLAYDSGNRTGVMHATTTDHQFNVLVTAESEGGVLTPSDVVVFQKQVEAP
jgi:hypothetical protein